MKKLNVQTLHQTSFFRWYDLFNKRKSKKCQITKFIIIDSTKSLEMVLKTEFSTLRFSFIASAQCHDAGKEQNKHMYYCIFFTNMNCGMCGRIIALRIRYFLLIFIGSPEYRYGIYFPMPLIMLKWFDIQRNFTQCIFSIFSFIHIFYFSFVST